VGYQLEDGALYRVIWPTLDRASESEPRRQLLFKEVETVEIVFYDQEMKEHDEWPYSQSGSNSETPPSLPKAVEIVVELERWGKIRRLFRVAQTLPTKSG
jgi:general secretion pathway protein J